ncbi:MAG: D-arabinono-1,4-lactone oxidase, partial [Myxococcota bacterium]
LPFLNVLKKFGKSQPGHLSFPFEGWTFAIDFPIDPELGHFLRSLDEMVLKANGRVYLGKDAFLRPDMFRAMYDRADAWLAIKQQFDPDNIFTSDLARRVGLVAS